MTDVSMSPVVRYDVEIGAGSGHTASGAAGWLGLTAAPTFAIMALWTGLFGGKPDMLCMGMQDASNGMALMYALMSAFHAAPWLRLISCRQSRAAGRRASVYTHGADSSLDSAPTADRHGGWRKSAD
jgi:hypothetical protein